MLLEESLEEYTLEKRKEFLKNISQVLLYTFLPLMILSLFMYLYFSCSSLFLLFLFYCLSSILLFVVRYYLLKRYPLFSGVAISSIFLCMSLIVLSTGSPIIFSLMSLMVSFTVLLLCLGEKWALGLVVLFLFLSSATVVFQTSSSQAISLFEESCFVFERYLEIKSYWLFFFMLFILYQGCVMKKLCNGYAKESLERYKYLANLEYKHRLLGKISKSLIHDISTPLSVLSGSIKILEDSQLSSKEVAEVKACAIDSLEYLEDVLENSFLFLKNSEKKEKFPGDGVVQKVLHILRGRLGESRIVVDLKLKAKVLLYGNQSLFARAVLNILINSIEELEGGCKEEKEIKVYSYVMKNTYVLVIRDNGKGIPKEVLRGIKSREFTLKCQGHLGSGLYFVFETIERQFGGVLEIESFKDEYAKVIFKVPLYR
jgi:signal transduction histidine kinase